MQYTSSSYQPYSQGAYFRADAVGSQLALGCTLCATAVESMAAGHFDHADRIVLKLWESVASIHRHLLEPRHLPEPLIPELRLAFLQLQDRVVEIEARLSTRS